MSYPYGYGYGASPSSSSSRTHQNQNSMTPPDPEPNPAPPQAHPQIPVVDLNQQFSHRVSEFDFSTTPSPFNYESGTSTSYVFYEPQLGRIEDFTCLARYINPLPQLEPPGTGDVVFPTSPSYEVPQADEFASLRQLASDGLQSALPAVPEPDQAHTLLPSSAHTLVFGTPRSAVPQADGVVYLQPWSGVSTPFSEARELRPGGNTLLASAPTSASAGLFERTPFAVRAAVTEADQPAGSGDATVFTSLPPLSSSNEPFTGGATVSVGIPSSSNQRKRGRPRKYFAHAFGGQPAGQPRLRPESPRPSPAPVPVEEPPPEPGQEPVVPPPSSKGEVRPASGSRKKTASSTLNKGKTTLGLGSKWNEIQPATIIVSETEDVSEKIISFAKDNGAVFILAASGVLSSIELLPVGQPETSMSFEGKFEILSLAGTLLLNKEGGFAKTGHLTITVAGVDGRVLGGRVHGSLIAASTVQIVGGTITPAAKGGSRPSHWQPDQFLKLHRQITSMSHEWQTQMQKYKQETNEGHEITKKKLNETRQQLQKYKQEAQEMNQRHEMTMKELNETRRQLNETRQQSNETKQELSAIRQQLMSTQSIVYQMHQRMNAQLPPPPPY